MKTWYNDATMRHQIERDIAASDTYAHRIAANSGVACNIERHAHTVSIWWKAGTITADRIADIAGVDPEMVAEHDGGLVLEIPTEIADSNERAM